MTSSNYLRWAFVALAAVPFVSNGCGGDDPPPNTTTTGSAGSTTGTAGTGTTGMGGSAGSSGSGGSAGKAADSGDPRMPCGTTADGGPAFCTTQASGTNICSDGRCVDCLTDMDCAIEAPNTHCDMRPNNAGLLSLTCRECIDTTHCPAGFTCTNNNCQAPCGTSAMCDTDEVCDAPNNRCVECLSDANCATNTNNPRCNLTPNAAGLPAGQCEECLDNTHCTGGEICVNLNCEPTCTSDADCASDSGNNNDPYCHPMTRICAECATDPHCAMDMGNPYCSPTGNCESCLTDMHCTATPMTPYCNDNNCSECLTDAHCAALNPMQPYCDDGDCATCRTSADCPAGMTCNNQGNCTAGMDGGRGGG